MSVPSNSSSKSVHIVVQRYRSCKVLLQETEWVQIGSDETHCGLLVYVSFAQSCDKDAVRRAAQTALQLPVLTTGQWGDGVSETYSLLHLAKQQNASTSIILIPQANLISKVKSQGKSIQYHEQIEKSKGKLLFDYFVDCIRGFVLEEQYLAREQGDLPPWYVQWKDTKKQPQTLNPEPHIAPEQIFRNPSMYSEWNENTGIPTKDADGQDLTKSAIKKLQKLFDAHSKRHEKWKKEHGGSGPMRTSCRLESATPACVCQKQWQSVLDPSFCQIVHGSFGMRQGLEIQSDMGPFCHIFQLP